MSNETKHIERPRSARAGIDWASVSKFNFTYAMDGGAWLEDSSGYRQWESFTTIRRDLGQLWIDRQRQRQGWMTGCWVDVVKAEGRAQ